MANIEVDWQEDPEPVQIRSGTTSRDNYQNNNKEDSSNESKNLQPQSSNEESSADQAAANNQSSSSFDKKKVMSVDWLIYKAKKEIFGELPPIAKDFYIKDSEVSSISPNQAAQWRRALQPIPNPALKYEQAFKNYPEILDNIYKNGLETPTPIQSQGWSVLLRGNDFIGTSQTGTGKTLSFLLPALIHIEGQTTPTEERQAHSVLTLVLTREFVLQMNKEEFKYKYKNLKSVCLYGQTQSLQDSKVDFKGVDIVIENTGCFRHVVYVNRLHTKNFSFIVLDEVDKLLDIGLGNDVQVSLYDRRPSHQTVMMVMNGMGDGNDETWSLALMQQAQLYMKEPIQINVGSLDLAAAHTITQHLTFVEFEDSENILLTFNANMKRGHKVIIFCNPKASETHLYRALKVMSIFPRFLSSNMDQDDREAALHEALDSFVTVLIQILFLEVFI